MRKSTLICMALLMAITSGCTQDYDTFDLPKYQPSPTAVTPPAPPPADPPADPPPEEPPPEEPPPVEPPPVPPADVSGVWFSRAENNAVNCGMGEYVDGKSILITQDLADISMLTSTGDEFVGSVSGDIVEWTGSYPERNGMSDYTSATLTVSADSGLGNASWTWSDGVDSCNGTMAIAVERGNAFVESAANSRPKIADVIAFQDNVAFIQGSLGSGIDTDDFFRFTHDVDASIQAELSHFDTVATDLDLILLDEDLSRIAVSRSPDTFEFVEASIQAGKTYYLKVESQSLSGEDTYYLAIDVN